MPKRSKKNMHCCANVHIDSSDEDEVSPKKSSGNEYSTLKQNLKEAFESVAEMRAYIMNSSGLAQGGSGTRNQDSAGNRPQTSYNRRNQGQSTAVCSHVLMSYL